MNGFKEDIVSILRHNVLLHNKSIGLLIGAKKDMRIRELLALLYDNKVTSSGMNSSSKWNITWDFIVIPSSCVSINNLLNSFKALNSGGIIILEITGKDNKYLDKYANISDMMSATKVIYEDRSYLVFHRGVEYGN